MVMYLIFTYLLNSFIYSILLFTMISVLSLTFRSFSQIFWRYRQRSFLFFYVVRFLFQLSPSQITHSFSFILTKRPPPSFLQYFLYKMTIVPLTNVKSYCIFCIILNLFQNNSMTLAKLTKIIIIFIKLLLKAITSLLDKYRFILHKLLVIASTVLFLNIHLLMALIRRTNFFFY